MLAIGPVATRVTCGASHWLDRGICHRSLCFVRGRRPCRRYASRAQTTTLTPGSYYLPIQGALAVDQLAELAPKGEAL